MQYDDSMDDTVSGENTPSITIPFRNKSLLLATFPWLSVIPMAPSKLVEHIGDSPKERYTFVSLFFNKSMVNMAKFRHY